MQLFLINFLKSNNRVENNKLQKEYTKFFVKYVLKNYFNLDDELVKNQDGKPYLKNSPYKISISHSDNLIAILFDKNDCGIDVEIIKKRNFKKILDFFNIHTDLSKEEFYQWWTIYEAEYKSKIKKEILSFKYKNFICSISSENKILDKIVEIDYFDKKVLSKVINISEFYLPLKIKNTASTIKTNPIK